MPEKTFIIADQLVINSENILEVTYKDKDNSFGSQYLAKGELLVFPLDKLIRLNYIINTQLEFKGENTLKTSIALPKIFKFQNLELVDKYFSSKSIEISDNIITSLQNFTKIKLTFYSSSEKNHVKYVWSK